MKKISILIILIACATLCRAQQIELNVATTIVPPGKVEKLSRSRALKMSDDKPGKSGRLASHYNLDNTYQVGDITISLNSVKRTTPADELTTGKKNAEDLFRADKDFTATIETVGNKSVLIQRKLYGEPYYQFFCVNKSHTAIVNGRIEFNEGEQVKARSILDHILKNLKFKQD